MSICCPVELWMEIYVMRESDKVHKRLDELKVMTILLEFCVCNQWKAKKKAKQTETANFADRMGKQTVDREETWNH